MPNESELVQTRLAVVRDATDSDSSFVDVTDELTRAELQQSAFACEVIGTFYTLPPHNSEVLFGADIDNVYSSARYQVFLPSTEVLSWLCSYPVSEVNDLLEIGKARFASTRRRAVESGQAEADVKVHVEDFVSRKTAVFGMTRTGKSNTIKTLVTAVAEHAAKNNQPVGQLIFDPQGEYANVNKQDNTGLRLLGENTLDSSVRIYRLGADNTDPQIHALEMNFFDTNNFEAIVDFVNATVLSAGTYANIRSFANINWERPTSYGDLTTWERARLAFYGLLHNCGIRASSFEGEQIKFGWNKNFYDQFMKKHPDSGVKPNGQKYTLRTPQDASLVFSFMSKVDKGTEHNWMQRSDETETAFSIITKFADYSTGKSLIRELRSFHSISSKKKVENLIWEDMCHGRISIVDLSLGSASVSTIISERIVNFLLAQANSRFRNAEDAIPFQIVVEEAHNLFERGAKDVASNPWVRLSKEAAKYKIGLIYATQEVTSVDPRILANTSNWLVAHLNSDNETRELSHYYDFKTWADSLRKIEDQGFVRMKTYSGKYIIPVQIIKFDQTMINSARQAAGLLPLSQDD